jgi:hypothetical protein
MVPPVFPSRFCEWRLTLAYSRIMGAALGTIMAIIITHHMTIMIHQYCNGQ